MITVKNDAAVAQALRDFPEIAEPELRDASTATLLGFLPALQTYPPAPTGSRYRRTGTLGRLWAAQPPDFQALPSGWEASIGNATPYGRYVQGEQARSKQWTTVRDVERRGQAQADAYYRAAVERIEARINQVTN